MSSTATLNRLHAQKTKRARTRGQLIYKLRTEPELFEPQVADALHTARAQAVDAIGDVYDWDCRACKQAVITTNLTDPCPRCGTY